MSSMVRFAGIGLFLMGLWYLISRTKPQTPPTTCPTGYHLANGVCVPNVVTCPTGQHLVNGVCVLDTPIPPTTGIVDNFDSGTFVLAPGAISPNGVWRGIWPGGGIMQQKKMAGSTTDGIMGIEPQPAIAANETHSSLILSVKDVANFDMTFQMRTTAQLRTGPSTYGVNGQGPQPWETAWVLFRYTDVTHHYYFMIKNSGVELGKKDNAPLNANLEDQIFLSTPAFPPLVIGRWYGIRILAQGTHIQIWVDGAKVIDYTDNDLHDPTKITHGFIGLYCEDSRVEFNNMNVVALP